MVARRNWEADTAAMKQIQVSPVNPQLISTSIAVLSHQHTHKSFLAADNSSANVCMSYIAGSGIPLLDRVCKGDYSRKRSSPRPSWVGT